MHENQQVRLLKHKASQLARRDLRSLFFPVVFQEGQNQNAIMEYLEKVFDKIQGVPESKMLINPRYLPPILTNDGYIHSCHVNRGT